MTFTPSPPCTPHLPCSSLQMAGERHRPSFGTLPGYSGAKSPQPGLTGAGPRQRQRVNGDGGVCRAGWEEGDCIAGSNGCKPAGDPEGIGVSRENPPTGKIPPTALENPLAPGLGVQRGWHGTVGSAPCIQRGCMAWHGGQAAAPSSFGQPARGTLWSNRAAQPGTTEDTSLQLGWLCRGALPTPGGAPHPKYWGAGRTVEQGVPGPQNPSTQVPSPGIAAKPRCRGFGGGGGGGKGAHPRRGTVKRPPPAHEACGNRHRRTLPETPANAALARGELARGGREERRRRRWGARQGPQQEAACLPLGSTTESR